MATTYEPIATTTLSSAAASIDFTSISGSYTDLRVVLVAASDAGASIYCRYNSDTGTNYSSTRLTGNGTAAASASQSNTAVPNSGRMPVSSTIFGLTTIDIFSYAGSTYKTSLIASSSDQNGSGEEFLNVNLWRSTSAITAVNLVPSSGNFVIGTKATLYGITKA